MPKKELQDEFTLTLRRPVTLGTGADAESYSHLDLREPLTDEVLDFTRRSAKDPGDALKHLIARVSGAPLAVVAKIAARDFTKASNYLTAFMNPDLDNDEAAEEGGGAEDVLGK
jgi:hypothetical protein